MNYEEMSDFEINKRVFSFTENLDICKDSRGNKPKDGYYFLWSDGINWFKFNPCSNPYQAWAIILESKIAIAPCRDVNSKGDFDGWTAYYGDICIIDNKNPLRAAMIVFLIMKESENE